MPKLTQEEIRLLESLLKYFSPDTDTSKGTEFTEVEANKCADEAVYRRLWEYAKQEMGMLHPTPAHIQGIFNYLAHKGGSR